MGFVNANAPETTSLVVMAAGLGSRFGGVKQLAPVGPNGEVILDFTIRDGLAAGMDNVVLIVRSDIRADVEEHVANVHGTDAPVVYVNQDDLPPAREKPWGTVHATLSAASAVNGPFCLANADDYYGKASFVMAAAELDRVDERTAAIVAFELGNTLPVRGSVTRGVCSGHDGRLVSINETGDLQRRDDGTVGVGTDGATLAADTPVSMNLWAFHPSIMDAFRERFDAFLNESGSDPKSECLLPTEVAYLMDQGRLDVNLVASPETWTGITNPDDLEVVRDTIMALR